jgi:uncharacterized protein YpmB
MLSQRENITIIIIIIIIIIIFITVNIKFTLDQVMKTQRESRGIAFTKSVLVRCG